MQAQLATANAAWSARESYNELITIHGRRWSSSRVPLIAGLAHYLVPLMIGARTWPFRA